MFCSGAGYTTSGSKGTSTITYGNLGTSGTLTTGDSFDCDVNGDGEYNPGTERFYYVSDYYNTSTKSFEKDTAVLIYYNNVSAGSPNNNTTYAYDSSGENWHGPRTAISQLPTTSKWNNVNLKNKIRSILNENNENTTKGGVLPSNYSYEGYAARLLTVQEIRQATGNNSIPTWQAGELNNYAYLLENTKFSNSNFPNAWWLETSLSNYNNGATAISGSINRIYGQYVDYSNELSVRPAIEVSKKNIDY